MLVLLVFVQLLAKASLQVFSPCTALEVPLTPATVLFAVCKLWLSGQSSVLHRLKVALVYSFQAVKKVSQMSQESIEVTAPSSFLPVAAVPTDSLFS